MEFTVGKFLRLLAALLVLVAVGWLLYTLSSILHIVIIASLIAYILDPIASYFEARGLSRLQATMLIFAVFTIVVGLTIWFLSPAFFSEIGNLQAESTTPAASTNFVEHIEEYIQQNITFVDVRQLHLQDKLNDLITTLSSQLFSFVANLLSTLTSAIVIPFVVFFLLKDGRAMKKAFISYLPNRYFEMALNVLNKMDHQLGGYLRGQFIEAFVVGLLAVSALWILDVRYFTVIGIFAGLANLIPYVGPVAGAIPAITVTIIDGGGTSDLLYIVLAFSIVQLIDNIVLQPLVMSRSVNLHPLIIVFAVLIGGQFFGILGMLLAVPTAGIIKVTSSEIYNGVRKFNLI